MIQENRAETARIKRWMNDTLSSGRWLDITSHESGGYQEFIPAPLPPPSGLLHPLPCELSNEYDAPVSVPRCTSTKY